MQIPLIDIAIAALEDIKAHNIVTLDVTALTDVMDRLVIASGTSPRQVKALIDHVVEESKKAGYRPLGVEGLETAEWALVDFGDIVVHVMLPATRAFYELEKLWSLRPGDLHSRGE